MQAVTGIEALKNKFDGQKVWLVGCGPTLDDVDLKQIRGFNIFAVNAAITLFTRGYPDAYWFFRDARIGHEIQQSPIGEEFMKWPKFKIVTHKRAYNSVRDLLRLKNHNVLAYLYPKETYTHKRTVVEDVFQALKYMGFKEVFLLGIDHAIRNNKPYSNHFDWKECHFYDPRKPPKDGGKSVALNSMVRAMQEIQPTLAPMIVYNTSTIYPEPIFEHIPFDIAVQNCKGGDLTKLKIIGRFNEEYKTNPGYGSFQRCHKVIVNRSVELHGHGVKTVLELSCGRGHVARELAMRNFTVDVTEPCPHLLAKDLSDLKPYPYFTDELDRFAAKSYDFIMAINLADHLRSDNEIEVLLGHCRRIARAGFMICVNADRTLQSIKMDTQQWKQFLIDRGMSRVEVIEDLTIPYTLLYCWFPDANTPLHT